MKILIPTYMREENQKCWENIPEIYKSSVYLCTRSDRVDVLKQNYPSAQVIDIGITDGIADVRQRLLGIFGNEKILIVDDGCTFFKRSSDMKLEKINEESFGEMIKRVEFLLDEYAWVGISDRMGNNRVTESAKENTRSYSCYGINPKTLADNGIRFDGMWLKDNTIKLFEDFYVILSMLTKGLKNIVIYDYAFSHAHGKPGGNSVFRNSELQTKCYQRLSKEFPGLVTLTTKKDASWNTGDSSDRTEAVIAWKKAYEHSLKDFDGGLSDLFG